LAGSSAASGKGVTKPSNAAAAEISPGRRILDINDIEFGGLGRGLGPESARPDRA
jgi:hypothetical protein